MKKLNEPVMLIMLGVFMLLVVGCITILSNYTPHELKQEKFVEVRVISNWYDTLSTSVLTELPPYSEKY